jgi:hypothetical protein
MAEAKPAQVGRISLGGEKVMKTTLLMVVFALAACGPAFTTAGEEPAVEYVYLDTGGFVPPEEDVCATTGDLVAAPLRLSDGGAE